MEKENLQAIFDDFCLNLRRRNVLFVADSKSHDYVAYFKLLSYSGTYVYSWADLLIELGFKKMKNHRDICICHCMGRYSYYTMQNIFALAKKKGLIMPDDYESIMGNIKEI